MKSHFTEENSDTNSATDTADDHVWREHQLKKPQILSDFVVLLVVLMGFSVFIATWGTTTMMENAGPQQFVRVNQASMSPPGLFDRDDGR